MPFQLAKHDLCLKNKDNKLWERILQTKCNPGSLLVLLEVENVTCLLQKCYKETRGQLWTVYMGHGMKNHQIVQYIKASLPIPLMWVSFKVYHIQHRVLIVFPFPTHTHEKLNSFRWEIIWNATTWLVLIFECRAFQRALLCANLLNQNLILDDQKIVLHLKYTLQACLLVLVKLLWMSDQVTVSLNFDRFG
jgi:exonuclease I